MDIPIQVTAEYYRKAAEAFIKPFSERIPEIGDKPCAWIQTFQTNYEQTCKTPLEEGVEKAQKIFDDIKTKRIITAALGLGLGLGVVVAVLLGGGVLGIALGIIALLGGVLAGFFVGRVAARGEAVNKTLPEFQNQLIEWGKTQIGPLEREIDRSGDPQLSALRTYLQKQKPVQ